MADEHLRHLYVGEPDEDLIDGLEPDQLVNVMDLPVARRHLSRRVEALLWLLRVVLMALTAMVAFAFVVGVTRGSA